MIRYLLNRPIAVFLCFACLVFFGLLAVKEIPISLLPDIDIPEVLIKVTYPNNSADFIEENVTRNIRNNLLTLNGLSDLKSESFAHSAVVHLKFQYGTAMNLAFIEVNEKLDLLSSVMPRNMPRPQVARLNTSDIPIVRLQVRPNNQSDFLNVSDLTVKILRKRIEQISGISLVDINGRQEKVVSITPNKKNLLASGLQETDLTEAIQSANADVGSMSVNDGQYRYFIKFDSHLRNLQEIASIPIKLSNGMITNLGKLADVAIEEDEVLGYHLFNGKRGLVLTIHKQADAKMNNVMPLIHATVQNFRKDYPQIRFDETQDQSYLLDQAIQNLMQDLWYGGFFCILLLFLFVGNYSSPILMGISIPLSLCLTFICLYLFKVSFNIISLSGLALGIGMLIDNSIIVLDSITRERKNGLGVDDSCVKGVYAVMSPVISNVLTTVAIYLPLIYLNGLAGALVYDQAITLTISLSVSLLVAFILNPVIYKFFLKKDVNFRKDNTLVYDWIAAGYHKMFNRIFRRKGRYLLITIVIMPIGLIPLSFLRLQALPALTETETLVKIDWKEPITGDENKRRVELVGKLLKAEGARWEAEIGINQILFNNDVNQIENSILYYKCYNAKVKESLDKNIKEWFHIHYPNAVANLSAAPNAFTQLFDSKEPFFEARFMPYKKEAITIEKSNVISLIKKHINVPFVQGPGFSQSETILAMPNVPQMELYGINQSTLINELQLLFGNKSISTVRRFDEQQDIYYHDSQGSSEEKLLKMIKSTNGNLYPLKTFVKFKTITERKAITADKGGVYRSISIGKYKSTDYGLLIKQLEAVALKGDSRVSFHGRYFSDRTMIKDLLVIFLISLLMVYCILAIQFENLIHPMIVMLTIPLGVSGGLLGLWLCGGTLNIMSAIGFIVVLGIIVDDPSLKVETINRLKHAYRESNKLEKIEALNQALHNAGNICLKPLLLVSLTTSLSLVPVLFSGGIGNELQRPMAFVIIGGLTTGTFFTTWFIPLAYWFASKKRS
jgi:multidrug efflux pump subunit AcrB